MATETADTPTALGTNPPTNTPTLEPSPTATATLPPTPTATATATATVTAVPTPTFALTQREPTLAEIEEFLTQSPVLFFHQNGDVELLSLNDFLNEYHLSEHTEVFYEDVNGDKEMDLIVADLNLLGWKPGFVIVTLWNENQYSTPFIIMDNAKYSPGLRVTFEDWTDDATPEVIFDFSSDTGGTGFQETTWKRYVIHCQTSCNVVWWGMTGQLSSYTSMGLITTVTEIKVDEEGNLSLTIIDESFFAPDVRGFGHISSSHRVLTSTMKTYTWNGANFEQTSTNIVTPEFTVTSDSMLSLNSQENGSTMILSELDESDYYRPIFRCTLNHNNKAIGEPFECLPDFTKIFWQDITNDEEEELVVLATGLGTQQLLAYEVNEQETIQIANVTGDIIRSDLFGVRLGDVDADGQIEILAGRGYATEGSDCKIYVGIFGPGESEFCWWNELNLWEEIYRWDGEQFVPESEQ
ncbi:hypothetical protein [Candidatus Leptofilum sp.]|uniref:hypothetical protein n=1 Tax=Candidatus Leptofilum sp. TaxID=3241576 RepID=UPI003B5B89B5